MAEELLARLPQPGLDPSELAPLLPGLRELAGMVVVLGTSGGSYHEISEGEALDWRTPWDLYAVFATDAEEGRLRCGLYRRVEREVRLSVTYDPHRDVPTLERDCQRVAVAFRIDYAELEAEARRRKPAPKDLREHDEPRGTARPRVAAG